MKNKILIFGISLILLISLLVISFANISKETYAIGTTLVDTVIDDLHTSVTCTTVPCNGLYKVQSSVSDGTKSLDYRYIGASPNNYIKFNNELYRIIGVFDDNSHGVTGEYLVKIIRDRILGYYSWGAYNTSNTSGTYSSYKNDWDGTTTATKANLNILLNEFFYNKTDSSTTYGNCIEWTYYSGDAKTYDCSNLVGAGLDDVNRKYIKNVTWYLKGFDDSSYTKEQFYTCERSMTTEITNCSSGVSGTASNYTNDEIGLLYASDYMYASGNYSSTDVSSGEVPYGGNNWIFVGGENLLTPRTNANYVFHIEGFSDSSSGCVKDSYSSYNHGVRPVMYLKSDVYVTGGDGTFDNPYTIACDSCS